MPAVSHRRFPFRGYVVPFLFVASAVACGSLSDPVADRAVEAAAWDYRGQPTSVFLSEHGVGSRDEANAYYGKVLVDGDNAATFTLDRWKSKFIGDQSVFTAFYRNKTELGFWREMTCTRAISRGAGGCMVTNWGSPNEPVSGSPNRGTVAMNVSREGYARFYVFLPDGKLSPSAVLDAEGPKFMPRLCTVCHSGTDPKPGDNPDVGSVFREFDPTQLEERPGLPRNNAEAEWRQLNSVVIQANGALRVENEGGPAGVGHARDAVVARAQGLINGNVVEPLPPSWSAAGSEATTLWRKLVAPYCLACHRHNDFDWTDYQKFKYLQAGSIRNYLPGAPDPNSRVGAMPQAALMFDLMNADASAKRAVDTWLGAVACGGGCAAPVNGSATCTAGQCLVACNVGYDACPTGCCGSLDTGDDVTISAGDSHSCAIHASRGVSCWGTNTTGESDAPGGVFQVVSAGDRHSCGIHQDTGVVECWGANDVDQSSPPPDPFRAISAGFGYTCGIRSDGTLACWGRGANGVTSPPPGIFRTVSSGAVFACGVRADETIQCWGDLSQVGSAPTGTFLSVGAGLDFRQVWACGLRTDQTVVCWGQIPGDIVPTAKFKSVSLGALHACGVRSDDAIACWGPNGTISAAVPRAGKFRSVSAGGGFTCAVKQDGNLLCWGDGRLDRTQAPEGAFL